MKAPFLCSFLFQRCVHDCLDRVHAVFRLVEDDRLRSQEHVVGDLHLGDANLSAISLPMVVFVSWNEGRQCMKIASGFASAIFSALT